VRLLADTHAVLWLLWHPERLSHRAGEALTDQTNELLVSAAAVWEMSIKHRRGRLPEAAPVLDDLDGILSTLRAVLLPMRGRDAIRAGQLAWDHADPFDRMLAAQAMIENATLVSIDRAFDTLPTLRRLW
jgi:PIN domain nuclease of toxin-antitoxin system